MLHEIKVRSPRPNISLTLPATAAVKGIAMQESDVAGVAELADGSRPIVGFLCTDAVSQANFDAWYLKNTALAAHIGSTAVPGGLESPYLVSGAGDFEQAEEFEAEGTALINDVDADTALGGLVTFNDGKASEAAAGEIAEFVLVAKGLTPEVSGNFRARFRRLEGHVVAS